MNTHADKKQENKSQSLANAVTHKQSRGESAFQIVDNRPEAIAQKKLQEMANNSPQIKQLRTFHEMANRKEPIQGVFIGKLSLPLLAINPSLMGLNDSLFMKYYNELSEHKTTIIVEEGQTSYVPKNKILYLNGSQIEFLKLFSRNFASGKAQKGDGEVASSYIAMISHELSHARDHIIKEKDIDKDLTAIIDSELRAWAVEAISAIEVATKVKEMDLKKKVLVKSWGSIEPFMLDDLATYAESNEVINRLQRYIIREIKMNDKLLIQECVTNNKESLLAQIHKLKNSVSEKAKQLNDEVFADQ